MKTFNITWVLSRFLYVLVQEIYRTNWCRKAKKSVVFFSVCLYGEYGQQGTLNWHRITQLFVKIDLRFLDRTITIPRSVVATYCHWYWFNSNAERKKETVRRRHLARRSTFSNNTNKWFSNTMNLTKENAIFLSRWSNMISFIVHTHTHTMNSIPK